MSLITSNKSMNEKCYQVCHNFINTLIHVHRDTDCDKKTEKEVRLIDIRRPIGK